jgi:hypothetical protein
MYIRVAAKTHPATSDGTTRVNIKLRLATCAAHEELHRKFRTSAVAATRS